MVSAKALSYESPTLPTEGSMPASASRSVYLIDTYCLHSSGRRNTRRLEVAMIFRKRRSHRSGRAPLASPGRPTEAKRSELQQFWLGIAQGMTSESAALAASIAVMDQAASMQWPSVMQGLLQGVQDEAGMGGPRRTPSDDAAGNCSGTLLDEAIRLLSQIVALQSLRCSPPPR